MKASIGFYGRPEWQHPLPKMEEGYGDFKIKVKVLRPILFFHREQRITLDDLHKYFTLDAIFKLHNDKFIEYYGN